MKSVLYFNVDGAVKPFAKIVDCKNQVIFSPIALDADHMTIHKKSGSDGYVFTYSDKNKNKETWDGARVELAKKEGYSNPDKHRDYIANRNMAYLDGFSIPLIILYIKPDHYLHGIPEKYQKLDKIIIPVGGDEFEFSIYFTSNIDIHIPEGLSTFKTSIGIFGFEVQRISPNKSN